MSWSVRPAESAAEVAQAYELAARVFGPSYFEARAQKDRLLALDPATDPRDVVIALDGADVVALVRIVDRAVLLGGHELKVGGITSVAVRPDLQGQGRGRAVMEAAIARSSDRGDDVSIAFARRAVDGFYWRLGYVGLGCHPRTVVRIPAREGGSVRMEHGCDAAHLNVYADSYTRTYQGLPLSFQRSRAWWDTARERLRWLDAEQFVTVFNGSRAVGYFIVAADTVIEAACADEDGRDLLAGAVSDRAAGSDGEIALALHRRHPLMAAVRRFNHTESIRYAWDGGHVVRVLNGDAVARAFGTRVGASAAPSAGVALTDHDTARENLLRLSGLSSGQDAQFGEFPVWSRVDEF